MDLTAVASRSSRPPPVWAGGDALRALDGEAGGPRVLVVDDHPTNRLVMQAALALAGIAPVMAEDGVEAVAAWRSEAWDLVFMDIQMPRMDGVGATLQIRGEEASSGRRRTLIVALTANISPEEVAVYRAADMDDCIAKPIDVPAMLDYLRRTLSARPLAPLARL